MRILFLAHRLPYPPNKGDKIRSFSELAALSQRHEVDLFCFYDQAEDSQYFEEVRRYCSNLYAEKLSWLRSRVQALLAFGLGRSFTSAFFYSRRMARRIQEALRLRNYDLVFVFSSSMAPYVESASHVPRLLDMVDVDSDKWRQYAGYARPPISWLWRTEAHRLAKCEKKWAQEFSLTILSTQAEVKILSATVSSAKIEAFENRPDVKYFDPAKAEISPELRAWQPYVVFTGSMDYFPNVDAVTFFCREVFPQIRAKLPNARFVIAGRNPTRAVRKLAHGAGVQVTGGVSDIRPYLRGASVSVAPLRMARGVQTKIIEAMAMGLPVAGSRKAGMALPEALVRSVYIEDDPQLLAEFVIKKLHNPIPGPKESRGAVLDYVDNLRWEERLDALLLRAVHSHTLGREGRVPSTSGHSRAPRGQISVRHPTHLLQSVSPLDSGLLSLQNPDRIKS